MSTKTVVNEQYKGLVETVSIPAEIHVRADGRKYASVGTTMPIHCATPEQARQLAATTHHYCAIFSERVLAPLGELAYVRVDDHTAEKVFINRNKRLLLHSSDGAVAQWRCAPSFESSNQFVAGAPLVDATGALVSLVTARRGNHYAVSTFEGEGGYFETGAPWRVEQLREGRPVYGGHQFETREKLRAHLAALPPAGEAGPTAPPAPLLYLGASPRVLLLAQNGRQFSHTYLYNVLSTGIQYL